MNKIVSIISLTAFLSTTATSVLASASVPAQADHVNDWHNTGSDHQANNNPGDTAADRHNFDDATAGKSGNNPGKGVQK